MNILYGKIMQLHTITKIQTLHFKLTGFSVCKQNKEKNPPH